MSHWPSKKAKAVLKALFRTSWREKSQTGSHRQLTHTTLGDYTWAFHDAEEIGPVMMAKIAKKTGLKIEDF